MKVVGSVFVIDGAYACATRGFTGDHPAHSRLHLVSRLQHIDDNEGLSVYYREGLAKMEFVA